MMFMVTGRATNQNGSPIVRDGLVAALHEAGHSVVTAQPRRGSYAYVDYLVSTQDSIRRNVTKVRWANERGIRVIDYSQMWLLIVNNIEPTPLPLPDVPSREEIEQQAAARRDRQIARLSQQAEAREREILRQRREMQTADAAEAEAIDVNAPIRTGGTYNSETEETRERTMSAPIKKPAPARPPRRRIVTGR
jgi:hypothetical protein